MASDKDENPRFDLPWQVALLIRRNKGWGGRGGRGGEKNSKEWEVYAGEHQSGWHLF